MRRSGWTSTIPVVLAATPLGGMTGAAHARTVNFAGHELRTNINTSHAATGSVEMAVSSLQMSNGEYDSARSALSTGTFNLFGVSWSTSYTMNFSCDGVVGETPLDDPWCPGDGIAFVIAGGADTQVGMGGAALGYIPEVAGGAFENSLAFGFQTFWKEVYLGQGGNWENTLASPFGTEDADYTGTFTVSLSYNALTSILSTSISNGSISVDQDFADLALGSWAQNARIGFTSATGAAAEYSLISDWNFSYDRAVPVPEPAELGLLLAGVLLLCWRLRRPTATTSMFS